MSMIKKIIGRREELFRKKRARPGGLAGLVVDDIREVNSEAEPDKLAKGEAERDRQEEEAGSKRNKTTWQ